MYLLVPCHLFISYLIELAAAEHAKLSRSQKKRGNGTTTPTTAAVLSNESFLQTWRLIAWAHGINASACLFITTYTVYYHIHHPLIGTLCEIHAVVVWLKNISYAFTNRDLRHSYLHPSTSELATLPELYNKCPYPQNITLGNLCYFWWAPTL